MEQITGYLGDVGFLDSYDFYYEILDVFIAGNKMILE